MLMRKRQLQRLTIRVITDSRHSYIHSYIPGRLHNEGEEETKEEGEWNKE